MFAAVPRQQLPKARLVRLALLLVLSLHRGGLLLGFSLPDSNLESGPREPPRFSSPSGVPPTIPGTPSDYPYQAFNDIWDDTRQSGFGDEKVYVVQTGTRVVQRCILMTTDPGDLVLDPTCGSGTTAFVAEQWGRRWITTDTSRVALALARARIMGARYPYYLLADSPEGQQKEAQITRKVPSNEPTYGRIRQGFVNQRVPHITLKQIANNAEIDVIWERYQETLEPFRHDLNAALGESWEEWQIPRDNDDDWPTNAKELHAAWWKARIARQKDIDASIAANAPFEYLYDKTVRGQEGGPRRRSIHGREPVPPPAFSPLTNTRS